MATITLSPKVSELVEKAAALRGIDAETYASALVEASLNAEHEEFKEACQGIAAGLADGFAGRSVSWEDYLKESQAAREARRKAREERHG